MVFQLLTSKLINIFQNEEQMKKNDEMKKMMATPQNTFHSPNPLGNYRYTEEDWASLEVTQEGKQIKLKTYRIQPDTANIQNCKAIVVIFHQLNDHLNNSAHVAHSLVKSCGVTCVGFDFRGFGKSEGVPGWLESEEQHLSDCEKFLQIVEQTYPNKKIFLSGVSLGGMTSFLLGVKHPKRFAGQILYAPSIKDQKLNSYYGKKLAKVLGYIMPKMPTIKRSGGLTNKNPQIGIDQSTDPYLYNGKVIPGTIRTLLNMMDQSHSLYEQYSTPFLVIQGGIDKLVCPTLGQELIDRSPSKDKKLLFYKNVWHDIWMEDEIYEIIPQVCEWLNKRL